MYMEQMKTCKYIYTYVYMRVNLRCLKDSLQEVSVHQMLSDLTAL